MQSKIRTVGISALLCLALGSSASVTRRGTLASSSKSIHVLRDVLSGPEPVAFDAIVTQKSSCGVPGVAQFKVSQDTSGRRMMVAIQPLSIQGLITFDDGKQWSNYYPDEHRLVVLPSPRAEQGSLDFRMKLATQNYRLAMETDRRVAGRLASVVVAVSRHHGMPTRKFTVDTGNAVVLRVETVDAEGVTETVFDTKSIRVLPEYTLLKFTPSDNSMRVYRPTIPAEVESLESAERIVKFAPIRLRSMPFGFAVRRVSAMRDDKRRYVAQRITDGIASATLYQFAAGEMPFGPSPDGLDFSVDGVTLRLSGDMPYSIRKQFIEQIARSLGRTFRPSWEQIRGIQGLPRTKYPELATAIEKALEELQKVTNEFSLEAFDTPKLRK